MCELELPPDLADRIHSWHLFTIALRLNRLQIDRDEFVRRLGAAGVGFSVHWRPLHLHPYYQEQFGWKPEMLPVASREWVRRVSLPLFPDMTFEEQAHVIATVKDLCRQSSLAPTPLREVRRESDVLEVAAS